jgi:hypothetical protein
MNKGLCANCRQPIFIAGRGGNNPRWYHKRSASTACRPGSGDDRYAYPIPPKAYRCTGCPCQFNKAETAQRHEAQGPLHMIEKNPDFHEAEVSA